MKKVSSFSDKEYVVLKSEAHAGFAIKVKLEDGALMPQKKFEDDAGADIHAYEDVVIYPGETVGVRTGVRMSIPKGYEVQVRSRSGLALNHGVFVLNGVGTIDQGFIGEIKVILHNVGKEPFQIRKGDRIAQLVVSALANLPVVKVESFGETERGDGGFGSTGMR